MAEGKGKPTSGRSNGASPIHVRIVRNGRLDATLSEHMMLWQGKVEDFLTVLEEVEAGPIFDLVVTSPPYNIGKSYEKREPLDQYLIWQSEIIRRIHPFVKNTGSVCWQVGNYVDNGSIVPLDIELAPTFKRLNMQLRNRIIWQYGHGLHSQRRFSGRYETVMWYTKSDNYHFDLDPVRVPSKYPGKKHYRGPKKGQYSGNAAGKNPEDVWNIPNVKSNHIEKTEHPCQFPVGLIERLVLSMTKAGGLVFDPFAGVASSGVAAALHGRRYWGCEMIPTYVETAAKRLNEAVAGEAQYRPHDKPIYDHTTSPLSKRPSVEAKS